MKLNNDCIRDILLYVEENTTFSKSSVGVEPFLESLSKYDEETLFYHLSLMNQAKLLKVQFAGNKPFLISKLTWEGHQFIDNIRDNKVWAQIKDKSKKLSSVSLQFLISLAPTILEQMLK